MPWHTPAIRVCLCVALGLTTASAQSTPQIQPAQQGEAPGFTLHVTAREVLIELIARDAANRPVTDLKASDLEIVELLKNKKIPRKLAAFHVVDPAVDRPRFTPASAAPRMTLGGGCAVRIALHYILSYQPDPSGWTGGYHEILITTRRPGVTLLYRRRYYVAETVPPAKPVITPGEDANSALRMAACYHSTTVPPSFNLATDAMEAVGNPDHLRYSVAIPPEALQYVSISDQNRHLQLDYGVCTFDSSGTALRYLHTTDDRTLTPDDLDKALSHGVSSLMDVSTMGNPASIRFVARDRSTGNIGSTQVNVSAAADAASEKNQANRAPLFGSSQPKPDALCGDVYELTPVTTSVLPGYWAMDSIGALYTYTLNVPSGHLDLGIQGITPRSEWIGIDYHGELWITTPGQYLFSVEADDGAQLYIDDKLIADVNGIHYNKEVTSAATLTAGRHTLHIPYFQGPIHVALIVRVKGPGDPKLKLLDLRNFPPPPQPKN